MPISLLRSGRTPRVSWTYSARSLIWRVLPTADGLFVGEERDPVAREAVFFCVDAHDGRVLWERFPLGEGWWTGFAACAGGVLLLHGYATPDLPQHLKIFAVDAQTGTSLWNNHSVTFAGVYRDEVHASTPAGERVVLDLRTGERLPDRDPVAEAVPMDDQLLFPGTLSLSERSPASEVKGLLRGEPLGPAEVLTVADHMVVGYCTRKKTGVDSREELAQELAVINTRRRKLVFSDRLLERTSVPVPDVFFARDGMLYYIRERQHLVGVRFPAPLPGH